MVVSRNNYVSAFKCEKVNIIVWTKLNLTFTQSLTRTS